MQGFSESSASNELLRGCNVGGGLSKDFEKDWIEEKN